MHHEILLALLGHPGDLIDARSDGYFIRQDVSFLSKSQQASLNNLLKLGFYYTTLQSFVHTAQNASETLQSVYAVGMSHGIHYYLEQYSYKILDLEQIMLKSKTVLPLTQMMYELQDYTEILSSICRLLDRIRASSIHSRRERCIRGSRLLEILHRMTITGYPNVRQCMLRLQQCCHRVLYRQSISWMLYGELIDPYNEFFVKPSTSNSLNPLETQENALRSHMIDIVAVPTTYFPMSIAESIYYIGNSMKILTMDGENDNILPGEKFQQLSQEIAQTTSTLAQEPSFSILRVEHAVEKIRMRVAEQLYQKVVVDARFLQAFDEIKDYFLLFRGEVYHSLMEKALLSMRQKPTIKSEEELNRNVYGLIDHDTQAKRHSFLRTIRFHFILQTFFFKGFTLTNGLCLEKVAKDKTSKYLHTAESNSKQKQPYGLVFWKYQQYERYSFLTNIDALIPASDEIEERHSWKSSLLIIIQNTDSFHVSITKDLKNSFNIETEVPSSYRCIIIELDLERPDRFASVLIVKPSMYLLTKGSSVPMEIPGLDKSVHVAMHNTIDASPIASVAIGYAPVTHNDNSSATSLKKSVYVSVNEIFVFEACMDLQEILQQHPLYGTYWLGLGLGPVLRISKWTCDKYPERSARKSREAIQIQNRPVSNRELWNHLELSCNIAWPISLLITKDGLHSYNRLFQICFRLKRLQYALESAWKSGCYSKRWQDRYTQVAVCALHSRMLFCVKNIQLYFQITVIDASFQKCRENILMSNDFDQVKRIHEEFIATLSKKCFVYNKCFLVALESILQKCWHFVDWICLVDQNRTKIASHTTAVPKKLEKEFAEVLKYFCGILQHMEETRALFFLLNYNEFNYKKDEERR